MEGIEIRSSWTDDNHVCEACEGKMVVTMLNKFVDQYDHKIGYILPCETFKSIPRLCGVRPDNIDDMSLKDAMMQSRYIKIAKELRKLYFYTKKYHKNNCFGLWLKKEILDEDGNIKSELGGNDGQKGTGQERVEGE